MAFISSITSLAVSATSNGCDGLPCSHRFRVHHAALTPKARAALYGHRVSLPHAVADGAARILRTDAFAAALRIDYFSAAVNLGNHCERR
jgi:hypothetical protein